MVIQLSFAKDKEMEGMGSVAAKYGNSVISVRITKLLLHPQEVMTTAAYNCKTFPKLTSVFLHSVIHRYFNVKNKNHIKQIPLQSFSVTSFRGSQQT